MTIKFANKKQEELYKSLNEMILDNGFNNVLFVLESIAAKNDDELGENTPWNSVRESIESSFKDIEEWTLSCEVN